MNGTPVPRTVWRKIHSCVSRTDPTRIGVWLTFSSVLTETRPLRTFCVQPPCGCSSPHRCHSQLGAEERRFFDRRMSLDDPTRSPDARQCECLKADICRHPAPVTSGNFRLCRIGFSESPAKVEVAFLAVRFSVRRRHARSRAGPHATIRIRKPNARVIPRHQARQREHPKHRRVPSHVLRTKRPH